MTFNVFWIIFKSKEKETFTAKYHKCLDILHLSLSCEYSYLSRFNINVSLYLHEICLKPCFIAMPIMTVTHIHGMSLTRVVAISINAFIAVPPRKRKLTMRSMATVNGLHVDWLVIWCQSVYSNYNSIIESTRSIIFLN